MRLGRARIGPLQGLGPKRLGPPFDPGPRSQTAVEKAITGTGWVAIQEFLAMDRWGTDISSRPVVAQPT